MRLKYLKYVVVLGVALGLTLPIGADHHERGGPTKAEMIAKLPAALQPAYQAGLDKEAAVEPAHQSGAPAAIQAAELDMANTVKGALEATLAYLPGASPEEQSAISEVLNFFAAEMNHAPPPAPGMPAPPPPPPPPTDVNQLVDWMIAEVNNHIVAIESGTMPPPGDGSMPPPPGDAGAPPPPPPPGDGSMPPPPPPGDAGAPPPPPPPGDGSMPPPPPPGGQMGGGMGQPGGSGTGPRGGLGFGPGDAGAPPPPPPPPGDGTMNIGTMNIPPECTEALHTSEQQPQQTNVAASNGKQGNLIFRTACVGNNAAISLPSDRQALDFDVEAITPSAIVFGIRVENGADVYHSTAGPTALHSLNITGASAPVYNIYIDTASSAPDARVTIRFIDTAQ